MEAKVCGRAMSPLVRNMVLVSLALGALVAVAVAVSAIPGTGVQIATDPADQPAGRAGLDILRVGATSTSTGSTGGYGQIDFYIAVNTRDATTSVPRHPDSNDFSSASAASPGPGFRTEFYVLGGCYGISPSNSPGGGNSWNTLDLLFAGTCTPSGSPLSCYCGIVYSSVVAAEWVCNEAHFTIPNYWFNLQATNGDIVEVLDTNTFSGPATGGTIHDQMAPGVVGNYTWGTVGGNTNPTGLTATYIAASPTAVRLTWTAPVAGNVVAGYRIERRLMPSGTFSTIYTSGPMLSPPTTYDDTPAPSAGTYEYRVSALRCYDLSIVSAPITAQITLTAVPPPPVLSPSFTVDLGPRTCQDSAIRVQDRSVTPTGTTITSWSWDFGNGVVTGQSPPPHVYAQPGTYNVTLTVRNSNNQQASFSMPVNSVGIPNCCPVLGPLDNLQVVEGGLLSFRAVATDYERSPITYRVRGVGVSLPSPAAIGASTGLFTWQTAVGQAGTYHILVDANDGQCTVSQPAILLVYPIVITAVDADGDGIPDVVDNCPSIANHDQEDSENDGIGDFCDPSPCGFSSDCTAATPEATKTKVVTARDTDHDGIPNVLDDCPQIANNQQADMDGDGQGDACDIDIDGDGVVNGDDNCPVVPNADQKDCTAGALGAAGNTAPRAGTPQGVTVAKDAGSLSAQMPKMGIGAIAFVLVAIGAIFLVSRLKK